VKITTGIDSQPLSQGFSFSKQKAKALHGVRKVLIGIVADQRIYEKELLFLDSWLKSKNCWRMIKRLLLIYPQPVTF